MKSSKYTKTWAFIALAACLVGCSGNHGLPENENPPQPPVPLAVEPLHGSSAAGIDCMIQNDVLAVSFSQLATGSQFVRVALPAGRITGELTWLGVRDALGAMQVLTLAAPAEGAIELGVVPLPGYTDAPVLLNAALIQAPDTTSSTFPDETALASLQVAPAGFGQVAVSWIQDLPGDYNFDGMVDVADLAAIAEQYGRTVDRTRPGVDESTEYWVDGAEDGSVDERDAAVILEHYGWSVAGYNVRRNGALVPGAGAAAPSITRAEAGSRTNLPPQYTLTLTGSTADAFLVAPVDASGREGSTASPAAYTSDMIVKVEISGVDLAELLDEWPGGAAITKEGTRVILPGDIVGRPTLARPAVVTANTAIYTGLPRGQKLLLDIRYLPLKDLATGSTRNLSTAVRGCSGTVDDPFGLQYTAIPFELPLSGAMLEIDAAIAIAPNPAGGYFIDLAATQVVAGQENQVANLRLSFLDGVLTADTDANGSFADEAPFYDDDRDQISDRRLEQVQSSYVYPDYISQPLLVEADVLNWIVAQGYLEIGNILPIVNDGLALPTTLTLYMDEGTVLAGPFEPLGWNPGDRVMVDATRWQNPADERDTFYWVNHIEPINRDPSGPDDAQFNASDDQELQIELSWLPLPQFQGYLIYRYQPTPDGQGYLPDGQWEIGVDGPYGLTDGSIIPGLLYRYKLYGVASGLEPVLLGEDFGQALDRTPYPDEPQLFYGLLEFGEPNQLALVDEMGSSIEFAWDEATIWIVDVNPAATPQEFWPGDFVTIVAVARDGAWYALQVEKSAQWNPPPDPIGNPGGGGPIR